LLGLVGLLLVAACATVANILLAAATGRRHELALRLALGAARRRIVQQLAVEGLLLAAAGAALGLLFSFWAADGLVRLLSTSYDIVIVDLAPDRRVIAFAAMVAAAARRPSRWRRWCAPRASILDRCSKRVGGRSEAPGGPVLPGFWSSSRSRSR
jgi:predicted lysophospholipase L1 biosynthesis ABC-type transport system permease subunit